MTLHELLSARVRAHPEAEALRILPRTRDPRGAPEAVSFATLERRARHIAAGLCSLDPDGALPPSARVAILADTRLEWVLVDVACAIAGLVSVPLFPNVEPKTLERVLAASDARIIVVENPWQAKKVLDVYTGRAPDAAPPPRIVLIEETLQLASGASVSLEELGPRGVATVTLADIEERGAAAAKAAGGDTTAAAGAPPPGREAPDAESCWTICYTPGTEGQPKGVMWTHANLAGLARALASVWPSPDKATKEPDVQLLASPLAQAFARTMLWVGLVGQRAMPAPTGASAPVAVATAAAGKDGEAGGGAWLTTALARSEASVFEDAARLKPTVMVGVPSVFERARGEVMRGLREGGAITAMVSRWVDAPDESTEPTLGERIRRGVAERVVRPALQKRFGGRCRLFLSGGAPLAEGVQTFYLRHQVPLREAYGLVETCALTHLDLGAAPTRGAVGPPLPGVEQRLGSDDELFVRGPQVSPGYWRDPAETSKVFDAAGWFATGDLARVDERGVVYITGRKREIIALSNGRTLAPRPIEAALREEPLVSQALVHGERRDFATALIALDRGELERFAKAQNLGHLDFDALSRHPSVHQRISALVQRVNERLPTHAVIKKHAVLATELSADDGTLSPTQTLRRERIAEHYRGLLDSFYAELF